MLNFIWLGMLVLSFVVGVIEGRIPEVVKAATDYAQTGFQTALGLVAIMSMWLGIMSIARDSGLVEKLAYVLKPVMRRLFPDVPEEHPAMGSMILNIAANMLGIGNAATPFGLQAMKELQTLNQYKTQASDAMCTFLAINTSSVQLIPITVINFLAINHSSRPNDVIISSLMATSVSTAVALVAVKFFSKRRMYRINKDAADAENS